MGADVLIQLKDVTAPNGMMDTFTYQKSTCVYVGNYFLPSSLSSLLSVLPSFHLLLSPFSFPPFLPPLFPVFPLGSSVSFYHILITVVVMVEQIYLPEKTPDCTTVLTMLFIAVDSCPEYSQRFIFF